MRRKFLDQIDAMIFSNKDILLKALESIASGVYLVNRQGVIVYWNRAAEQITGYSREEMVGNLCGQLPGEVCKDGFCGNGILSCRLFQNEDIERECRIEGKDGKAVYLLKSARLMKDENDGKVMGIVNLVDITRIKEADHEIRYLKSHLKPEKRLEKLVGDTPLMHKVFADIKLAAQSEASVLITGESGTGKELAAQAIHSLSSRRNNPFITANCCSLPETLLESDLFGHVRGAFTGAIRDKVGRLETADTGTIFIDEIGDLPLSLQIKLLRFMQSKTIERIGQNRVIKLDVRIISATNNDLTSLVENGSFREDLFYRINVFPIRMPSLRERKEDIPLLIEHFVKRFSRSTGKKVTGITKKTVDKLKKYHWPGNVRELENAIEHAFVRIQGNMISEYDLPQNVLQASSKFNPAAGSNNNSLSRSDILKALADNDWRRQDAARSLGISRVTLWKKMKYFHITRPE